MFPYTIWSSEKLQFLISVQSQFSHSIERFFFIILSERNISVTLQCACLIRLKIKFSDILSNHPVS